MSGGHVHGADATAGSTGTAGGRHRRSLIAALALTSTYLVAEVVGALLTNSLALLADAAHMLTDVGGLALALFAIWFASRPVSAERTFGYLRAEIVAALTNSVVLLLMSGYILYEAWGRLFAAPDVDGVPVLVVAGVGLVVNLVSMRLLAAGAGESLNLKGAYLEVLADMLGSVGVLVSAVIILTTGWHVADPIVGALIGLFIVPRTWGLLSEAVNILMEASPASVDVAQIETELRALPHVQDVHDLHVWTVTSGVHSLTGHLVVGDGVDEQAVLVSARNLINRLAGIDHCTLQVETSLTRSNEAKTLI
jgi:cobalt-zinc-cadmium efflux system protein